jgi:AcrR family transcriptional regulator
MVALTILEAAEVVFAERGLEARLEDVAAHAGVAVGTLYNYFKDRQSLVEALLDAHRSQLRERLSDVVARTEGRAFRERLEAVLAEIVTVSLPKQRLRLLLLQAAPHRFLRRSEARESLRIILGPMFDQARRNGQLAPDPDGLQLQLLLGLVHAALAAAQESPPLLSVEAFPKVIAGAFLDGVGGRGNEP